MNRHSRAARTASFERGGSRRAISLALVSLVALLALVFASSASALTQRPFKEVFGSAAQPAVEGTKVTIDRRTGDVLVEQQEEGTIMRFKANGEPAPFAALGTNVIDGKEEAGKPCSEEPASCDKTPQDGLTFDGAGYQVFGQIAVDESNGPTAGNIYVIDRDANLQQVYIFSAEGSYLGVITGPTDEEPFPHVKGLAVNQAGELYVSAEGEVSYIEKYRPTENPPVNTDAVSRMKAPSDYLTANLALGSGPTAGKLFALGRPFVGGPTSVFEFDVDTGALVSTFATDQIQVGAIAVDPQTGALLVPAKTEGEVAEYDPAEGPEPVRIGRILTRNNRVEGFDINAAGDTVVGEGYDGEANGQIFRVYGPPATVPSVTIEPATDVTGSKATLSGTVNGSGTPVTSCFFEYGIEQVVPCKGSIPDDSKPHRVEAEISELNASTEYQFRLVATNDNGREESGYEEFTTLATVTTEAATAITTTSATLNGIVRPEGKEYTACFFEYGLASSATFDAHSACIPGEIGPNFSPQPVEARVGNLQVGQTYRFRPVVIDSKGNRVEGEELTFTTHGSPQITEVRARDADQTSVTLEGKINPSGFATTYRFEWGETAAYGHRTPVDFGPFVGSGEAPVRVSAQISGLSPGATYHYRITAGGEGGNAASVDHRFETLNSCGLPEARCFELVSRSQAGPVAVPGYAYGALELHFQAARDGGAFAYEVESGYPDATKGGEVLYRGSRGPSDWKSTQLSVPLSGPDQHSDDGAEAGIVRWLSEDLTCGFVESFQQLTDDPGARLILEEGGTNFYRENLDGSFTAVTSIAPEKEPHPEIGGFNYFFGGAADDCHSVLFRTVYRYPGIPVGGGLDHLYEWNNGELRSAGFVPGPGGEEVKVSGAEVGRSGDTQNAVSEDGSRVFISAERQTSPNAAEIGRTGVFVREPGNESGAVTRDVSLSETETPDRGATYQWATADGSRVLFTANAGLTAESNAEGEDLYEYDLATEKLTDRSVVQSAGGADVEAFIGASADLSRVYFASRNQLVPGRGRTLAQNEKARGFSIYSETGTSVSYVGGGQGEQSGDLVADFVSDGGQTAQVSPDGRYLSFESHVDLTGYKSGGAPEVYLYDADGGSRGLTCVSCRQDGLPSLAASSYQVLAAGVATNPYHHPRFLTEREGEPRIFFSSPDALAPGAVAGQNNVYEWSHDQVFRLTSAPSGTQTEPFAGVSAAFVGADAAGTDAFLISPENLNHEDGDQRLSIYDARIGGGFPEPPPPPTPCNANAEGSCQGAPQGGPSVPAAASATFAGPGNPKQTQPRKKKRKQKTHKKKSKKHSKKKGHGKKARHANGNRRAGK